jgi:beta-phosphoglucomutase-like phosphatase (HAD superfamily)
MLKGGGSMAIQLVLFDWDGTLVDTRECAYGGVCAIFDHYGIPVPSIECYLGEVGSDYMAFYHKYGIPSTVTHEDLNKIWNAFLVNRGTVPKLRKGALQVLRACKARFVRTGIVSSNTDVVVQEGIKLLSLSSLIDCVQADALNKVQKLQQAMDFLRVSHRDALYVDDTYEGVHAARLLGMKAMGITGGFNLRERILEAHPHCLISELDELIRFL